MFSHAGAPHKHSLLTIHCSGVLKISQKARLVIQDPLKLFSRMLSHSSHLIQPVQSPFSSNHFNGVSFEWALTHRSFSRILPDSSYFPEGTLKFFSKFDVRMSYHQSNAFLLDLPNSFHRWLNLSNFHFGVPQQFMVVFLVVILGFLKTEEDFSLNLAPFSSRSVMLA